MTTLITLPSSIMMINADKKLVMVDTTNWSADFIVKLMQQGWRIRMDRSTAKAPDPIAARTRMFDLMAQGVYTHAGRGPGSSSDVLGLSRDETETVHRWLVSEADRKGKKSDLEKRLQSLAKDMIRAEQPEISISDLADAVPDVMNDIIEQIIESDVGQKILATVQAERKIAEEKAALAAKKTAAVTKPFAGLSLNRK